MAGLCEGGNEPPGSLKARKELCCLIRRCPKKGSCVLNRDPGPQRRLFASHCIWWNKEEPAVIYPGTAPRYTQPPIKLSTGSFPGVKGGQSVVPTTPPHSSAEVMESMGLYLHAPKCLHGKDKVCTVQISLKDLCEGSVVAFQEKQRKESEFFLTLITNPDTGSVCQ
ncbi:hypothetical protein ANN_21071 [Periplaneta americana]|uniref:Uncharacterized protein n=1 Tax=Periplaneta americana TaxID=6978 RepID=A0ABQ8SFH8_PERAM|nr:hypothetical protein ANN_21071 [Periplaneta americana]